MSRAETVRYWLDPARDAAVLLLLMLALWAWINVATTSVALTSERDGRLLAEQRSDDLTTQVARYKPTPRPCMSPPYFNSHSC